MAIQHRFDMRFVAFEAGTPLTIGGVRATPFEVRHPSGAPPYALRFESGGKVLSFSGDTEWVDNLLLVANGADLYISECYGFDVQGGYHMTWLGIEGSLDRLAAKRVLLTHMSSEMLAQRGEVRDSRVLLAEDGMIIDV
jgi:ribonuclease BN (tRNA processing enzyme)